MHFKRRRMSPDATRVIGFTRQRAVPLLFVAGLAICAVSLITLARAATGTASREAEQGSLTAYALACSDNTASAGQTVKFGRSSCTSTTPASGQGIAWNDIKTGPGGAWHRLLDMGGGTWLRVLTVFPANGRSELEVWRSNDYARTWTKLSGVNDGQRLVDNGFLYRAPNGDILLSGRNLVGGQSYKISQWRSTDKGVTWQREGDIDSATGNNGGLWEPYYYTLPDNKIAVMYADETRSGYSQVLVQRISGDNGTNWGTETVVVSDGAAGRPGMPAVTRMKNGQYLFAYEVCGTQGCGTFYKKSADGSSWPSGTGSRLAGQVCGPFVATLSTGRIVITSCRVADGNNTSPISYSDDNGSTWKTNTAAFTDAGQYGEWPALYQIGPDEIAAVAGNRIRFGNFKD